MPGEWWHLNVMMALIRPLHFLMTEAARKREMAQLPAQRGDARTSSASRVRDMLALRGKGRGRGGEKKVKQGKGRKGNRMEGKGREGNEAEEGGGERSGEGRRLLW